MIGSWRVEAVYNSVVFEDGAVMSNPLVEYYNEMQKIKVYERHILGTVMLSIVVLIGAVRRKIIIIV